MTPEADNDDLSIEWLERDDREWVVLCQEAEQVTARMTCTYLEAAGIEARVSTKAGQYCVEVPAGHLEAAQSVYAPGEAGVEPAMQEDSRKTGIHTGHHLRERLARQSNAEPGPKRTSALKWILRVLVLAALVALIFLILAG